MAVAIFSPMKEIVRYPHCFVCGEQNPSGLQAKFFEHEGVATAEVVADSSFEGYKGIYHGGIISALLDEVMIKAVLAQGIYAVTAELTIRFHRPVTIGEKLKFRGKIVSRRLRLFSTKGEALGSDGTLCATATGKYVEAGKDLRPRLVQSTEA
jgi:uncharacterized protein (TIGR00369 family)